MTTQARWWGLGALALSMLTIGLDTTVLTVALPTLAVDLGASTAQLQWISTSYTLVLAAMLLPAGALGERYGYKRLLMLALLLFGASSVWSAYSGSAAALIMARSILGIGAALMIPLSMAVLPSIFPDTAERARALNIWVTSTAVGMPLGPIVGGWLLAHAWWGSIFLINVPLAIIGFAAVAAFIPQSKGSQSHSPDIVGVVLSSVGLTSLTFGFIRAGLQSWSHVLVWLPIAAGVALLSMFGVLFALPLFYQAVQGNSTLGTGLRLLPLIVGLVVGTLIVGRIPERLGTGAPFAGGLVVTAASLAAGAFTTATTSFAVIATWLGVVGVGMGLVMPTALNAALGALEPGRAGSGSALIQALRQAGGTIGVALLGTVINAGYRGAAPIVHDTAVQARIDDSVSSGMAVARAVGSPDLVHAVQSAFVHGMSLMLLVGAVMSAVLAIVAATVLRRGSSGRHRTRRGQQAVINQRQDERQSVYAGR